IELVGDRGEGRIAEILVLVTGQQADAVGVERVEGVFDLSEAALRVGWRDHGEQAEAAGMVPYHLGAVLVELARKAARLLDVVSVPDPGLDDREDPARNPALVHLLDRGPGRPFPSRR